MSEPRDLWGLPRRLGFVYGIIGAVLVASACIPKAAVRDGPVICLFRSLTGHPCPGCGLTRSFVAVADLRVADAFAHHLFGPPLFAGLVALVVGRIVTSRSRVCWFPDGLQASLVVRVVVVIWLLWAIFRLGASISGRDPV
jgi:hypothetical protein